MSMNNFLKILLLILQGFNPAWFFMLSCSKFKQWNNHNNEAQNDITNMSHFWFRLIITLLSEVQHWTMVLLVTCFPFKILSDEITNAYS